MSRTLPDQAYAALAALKAQASASTAMLIEGRNDENERRLMEAQSRMAANEPWTRRIVKALMQGDDSLTIDSADEAWLESVFVGISS